MNSVWRIASLVAVAACTLAQQQPKQDQKKGRDLKYEENNTAPAPSVAVPRGYALIVGIANYKNLPSKSQLEFSERDADAIYSILISPEGGNFRAENVHRLTGAQATMANLKRELETWLPSVAKEDDRVVIYFAGHGFISEGRAYLAPYDLDPANIPGTGYPMETLGQVAGSRIKAKWKVLLTDACHSGAITPDAEAQALNQSLLDMSRSMFSLTASRDRERSFESKDWGSGHGIFTYYVVKGLEGEADESGDGIVTADELSNYVRRNVREATKGQQNPTSDRGSFDPNMLLAFLPNGLRVAHQPPPVDGTLIFESNMDGVEVFVDGTSRGIVGKGATLRLPGMRPGSHTIQGVKMGYEPDGPRDEVVYPGRDSTVTIKISIARRRTKAAVDELNDGLALYNKGFADNYKKAAEHFEKALQIDPTYSQAALYLGRTYNSLFDEQRSEAALRKAIMIDPDYLEARVSLAGMLLDTGAVDESIRQLNLVTQRDKTNAVALYMQAQAYRMKDLYPQSIESARAAIKLAPAAAEPHLWLAESLAAELAVSGVIERVHRIPPAERLRQQTRRENELLCARIPGRRRPQKARRANRHLARHAQPGVLRPLRFRAQARTLRAGRRLLPEVSRLRCQRRVHALRLGAVLRARSGGQRQSRNTGRGAQTFPDHDRSQRRPRRS